MSTQAESERRNARRGRVVLGGKLVWPDRLMSTDCRLRDLSDTGAQLVVGRELAPGDPLLIVTRQGMVYETSTVWRRADRMGLRFRQGWSLNGALPPHLRGCRSLWLENQPRTGSFDSR